MSMPLLELFEVNKYNLWGENLKKSKVVAQAVKLQTARQRQVECVHHDHRIAQSTASI
jgi:hypothetical protein